MSLTPEKLQNADADVQFISEIATKPLGTAVNRLGHEEKTVGQVIKELSQFNYRGNWSANTNYNIKDVIANGGLSYVTVLTHTSGSSFATDLAAGRWVIHQGATKEELLSSAGSAAVGTKGAGGGAVTRTVGSVLNERVSVLDYIPPELHNAIRSYTIPDTTDLAPYFQAACVAANGGVANGAGKGGTVRIPNGKYPVSRVGVRDTLIEGESRDGVVIRGVAGGNADLYIFDAMLDRDGITANTSGNACFHRLYLDCTGSNRSGIRTFGGGQFVRDVWVWKAQRGFSLGLPIRSCFDGLRAELCQVVGIETFSNPGDTATSAVFNACLATGCYRGFHIKQLSYSSFNGCVAELSPETNWFVDGSVAHPGGGTVVIYSLVFVACATEGSGFPMIFRKCRDITMLSPRILAPDGSSDLMFLDDFQGTIKDFSTAGPVPGGHAHLRIENAVANGLVKLEGCLVSFSDYATMRRACTIFGTDPATGFITTSSKRFELDTATNTERTYFEIANIDGFTGTQHKAGDGTNLWRARRTGGVILSSNGAMAVAVAFQAGELHFWIGNDGKLRLEGKRPDGVAFSKFVTLTDT